jgi:uncharacterized Zn finger protein
MDCSCPDWAVPCKHLAAVFYLLAEAFDADPFLVLTWRGRGKEELLGNLRSLASAEIAGRTPDDASPGDLPPEEPPLNELADRFWTMGPAAPAASVPPIAPDVVLREVEPPGLVVRGKALADLLRPAYEEMVSHRR